MALSFFEELAVRLAHGVERLPGELIGRQADYLAACQRPDGGFAGREGDSDLYYTSFALRGLALLGRLEGDVASRAGDYLKSRLTGQASLIDLLCLIYSAKVLEASAGENVLAAAGPEHGERLGALFDTYLRSDGGYARTAEGQSSSTYYTFLVLSARQLLGQHVVDPEATVSFIRSRRRPDGGFVEISPMKTSGTNPTAAALVVLRILGALDDVTRGDAIEFLAELQTDEGGLAANGRVPLADLLSTFTGALSLIELEALDEIDAYGAAQYALSLAGDQGGFRGGAWDGGTDVEYTFYGLASLCLLVGSARSGQWSVNPIH